MKKITTLTILIVLFMSCMSSPAKKYYQLFLTVSPEETLTRMEKSIYIDRIDAQSFYDNFEIVYRDSPYQLNYYSYHFWAEKPGPLIRNSIIDYFSKNKIFSKIFIDLTSGSPDLTLKARIRAIEEEDHEEAWFARLSMEITIVDFKSEEVLYFHEFDRTERMPGMDISYLPVVLSRILKEELSIIIDGLAK